MSPSLTHRCEISLIDEAATLALGERLAISVEAPQVVFLRGELGAGKTTFSRGFLRGRGYGGPVKSPTYTLVEPYEAIPIGSVYHLDLYRLGDAQEFAYLGLDEYLASQGILLIEWPERAETWLPEPTLDITLRPLGSGRAAMVRSISAEFLEALTV